MTHDSPGHSQNPAYDLLFGSLSMDLDVHWREAALSRQRRLLEALLATDPEAIQRLHVLQGQLREADQQARAALTQLLSAPTLWQIVGVGHAEFDRLVQARGQGLLAEARLQQALGQLAAGDLGRLEALVAGTAQVGDRACQLVFGQEGAADHLQGVLVLHADAADAALLLYWPGSGGGLCTFATVADLRQALAGEAAQARPLELLPLAASFLANGVRAQWQEVQSRASAIVSGTFRYDDAPSAQASLQRLRMEATEDLAVGLHPARSQMLNHGLEQWRSGLLAQALPDWWLRLPANDRAAMGETLDAYLSAQRESEALLQRDLPPRLQRVQRLLDERLIADFKATGVWQVVLDLPQSVNWVKRPVIGSGAPGTPVKRVPQISARRVRMSLETLALEAIDDTMSERLKYLQVQVEASDEATRLALSKGIDKAWLERTLAALDVAGSYEELLFAVFLAMPGESLEAAENRRATLAEPWLKRLQWQAGSALVRGRLSERGWQMVHCALHADTPVQWQPDGWDLVMRSAMLTSGDWAELPQHEVGLGGVMLLEERTSGATVLYLPDAPGGRDFVEYPNVAAACQGLVDMARASAMLDYLGSRTVTGDAALHVGYVREAQRRNFEGFIRPGPVWPATTSLARHQVNIHMGRLVESHRSTSRSQSDLFMERSALAHGAVFDYIRMTLGMLPFVGAAVSVYDGWQSANASVAAFLAGRPGEGLDHIESVLLSFVDAGMDVLPSLSASGLKTRAIARARVRQQHASLPAMRRASQPLISRFEGYHSEVRLGDVAASNDGRYRGVHQLADGDFIVAEGSVCRVEWDADQHIWRLAATRHKGYRQPVTLDDAGLWTTYGALHGYLVPSGAGGGGALRRLAGEGWAGMAGFLRRRVLAAETEAARAQRLTAELQQYQALQYAVVERLQAAREALRQAPNASAAFDEAVAAREAAFIYYRQMVDKSLAALGTAAPNRRFAEALAGTVDNMLDQARILRAHRANVLSDAVANMRSHVPDQPLASAELLAAQQQVFAAFERVYRASRTALQHRESLEAWVEGLRGVRGAQAQMSKLQAFLAESATALDFQAAHISVLTTVAMHPHMGNMPASRFMLELYRPLRQAMIRAAVTYRELKSGQLIVSLNERQRLLENVLRQFRRFEANDYQLFDPAGTYFVGTYWLELRELNSRLVRAAADELATLEASLARMSVGKANARGGAGTGSGSQKRLFETVDDHLLVGSARRDATGGELMELHDPVSGQVIDTFTPQAAGRWKSTAPVLAPAHFDPAELPGLLDGARGALDNSPTLVSRVEELATRRSVYEPRDLEHMLSSHADQLQRYGERIRQLAGTEPAALIEQLIQRAAAIHQEATRLRVVQTKRAEPSGHRLQYLLDQGQVQLDRVGGRIELRNARGRVVDYLQEYVVRDAQSLQPIWYAHFHYPRRDTPFADFAKAHLKTVEQRRLGRTSQMLQEQSGHTVTPLLRATLAPTHAALFAQVA